MFASRKRVTDVANPPITNQQQPSASNQHKLELAKRLATRINISKNLGAEAQDITQQAAMAIMKGGGFQAPQVSVSIQLSSCNGHLHELVSCIVFVYVPLGAHLPEILY